MKSIFLTVIAVTAFFLTMLITTEAQALDLGDIIRIIDHGQGHGRIDHGREDRRWDPRDSLFCRADDAGWEEHWRSHRDCRECLAAHGRCIETCEVQRVEEKCQFEGRDFRTGRTQIFEAVGRDRREAESIAENSCYRSGFRDCRWLRCDQQVSKNVAFQRSCR